MQGDIIVVSEGWHNIAIFSDLMLVSPAFLRYVLSLGDEIYFEEIYIDVDTVPDYLTAKLLDVCKKWDSINAYSSRWSDLHAGDDYLEEPNFKIGLVKSETGNLKLIWYDVFGVPIERTEALKTSEARSCEYGMRNMLPQYSVAESRPFEFKCMQQSFAYFENEIPPVESTTDNLISEYVFQDDDMSQKLQSDHSADDTASLDLPIINSEVSSDNSYKPFSRTGYLERESKAKRPSVDKRKTVNYAPTQKRILDSTNITSFLFGAKERT